jgi:prophage antirepressor-like protein
VAEHYLIPFQFETHFLSVLIDAHEEPWWNAEEVCTALGIVNVSQACDRLDEDEKQLIACNDVGNFSTYALHLEPKTISTRTLHSELKKLFVNEPGLYALILGSRKKSAKTFKRWITHEVIPQIRKTGSYALPAAAPTPAEAAVAIAHAVLAVEKRVAALETQMHALTATAPPAGRFSCAGWLKATGKPFLAHTLFDNFKAACRRRELPTPYCPPGLLHAQPYYSPETLESAYMESTKQLSFLPIVRRDML